MSNSIRESISPSPATRRAGDYIFTSSFYPISEDGTVVRSKSVSPYVGESEMGAQTRSVLDQLRDALVSGGSSLDLTLRVEVHLVDAADFYEFKLVWQEYFPDSPPARKTIVVGDQHVIPGCRLNLHAVSLASNSSFSREVINAPDVPNAMAAEHVPHGIKAGTFLFPSVFPATDFETGLAVGKRPGFPNYGSDAEMQAHYFMQNLSKVATTAGTSIDQIVKSQFYETDLLNFYDVDEVWIQYVGIPPTRSSMGCHGFTVPGALFAANTIILIPDDQHTKEETLLGIAWHPEAVRKVHFSPGLTAGDWFFTAGQVAVPDFGVHEWRGAPAGAPNYWDDIEIQTEYTMELLNNQIVANDLTLADVIEAKIYLIHPRRDYRGFVRAWERIFSGVDTKPVVSLIPSTQANGDTGIMFPGPTIEIDLISKKGSG